MKEIWKDIEGYEGLYQISNCARVRSLKQKYRGAHIHKKKLDGKGYERASFIKNGKYKYTGISRLVAKAFIPNPENKPFVDHINQDKLDNRIENLRWATASENAANVKGRRILPKGVVRRSRIHSKNIYQAYARNNEKFLHLGNFETVEEAATKVRAFYKEKVGDFYVV